MNTYVHKYIVDMYINILYSHIYTQMLVTQNQVGEEGWYVGSHNHCPKYLRRPINGWCLEPI